MSLDPLTTIRKVEQFLLEEVGPSVAPELRSDVKAAAKLLNESVREIDLLSAMLLGECHEMSSLCVKVTNLLSLVDESSSEGAGFSRWNTLTITGQIAIHASQSQEFGRLFVMLGDALQQRTVESTEASELIDRCIALQTEFAERRMSLQSVF